MLSCFFIWNIFLCCLLLLNSVFISVYLEKWPFVVDVLWGPAAQSSLATRVYMLLGCPLCGLYGPFYCGRLTTVGALVGMIVLWSSHCLALPSVEAAGHGEWGWVLAWRASQPEESQFVCQLGPVPVGRARALGSWLWGPGILELVLGTGSWGQFQFPLMGMAGSQGGCVLRGSYCSWPAGRWVYVLTRLAASLQHLRTYTDQLVGRARSLY